MHTSYHMVGVVATCRSCGFENPRTWIGCSRCGALLGPSRELLWALDGTTQRAPGHALVGAEDAPTALFVGLSEAVEKAQPLLGQEATLAALRGTLKQAYSMGETRLLAIQGARGAGKTRALIAASELAARSWPDVRILYAPCRTHDGGAFAPFSRLLLDRFGVSPASSPSQVRHNVTSAVAAALPTSRTRRVAETAELLGYVAGIPFPESPALVRLRSREQELRERVTQALARFLRGDARKRPTLLLLDDVGDASNFAWEVLDGLLSVSAPIAIIMAGQSSMDHQLANLRQPKRANAVAIQALDDTATESLLRLLVPQLADPPPALVRALRHRSQGNPSALRQLIEAVRDRGLFVAGKQGLSVDMARLEQGNLPVTLDDAARALVSGLSSDERYVMELAAVVGERFWDAALVALRRAEQPVSPPPTALEAVQTDNQQGFVQRLLEVLERKRWIVQITRDARTGLSEYTFQHAETRGVLYSDSSEAVRQRRHGVISQWMSEATGLESVAELIAPHFARAGQPGRAGRAYLRAAFEERRRLRTTMALRLMEKALPLLDERDVSKRLDALHEHGSLLTVLGRYDAADAAFRKMFDLAWSLGARGRAGAALGRLARIRRQRGAWSEASGYLNSALTLFREIGDQRGIASVFDDLAQLRRFRGDSEGAMAIAKEALALRQRLRDRRGQALSLHTLACTEMDRGDLESADAHLNTSLQLREVTQDHEGLVQTRLALGHLAPERGDFVTADEVFRTALSSAREMNNHHYQSYLLNGLGEVCLATERYSEARAAFLDAQALATDMGDQRALDTIRHNLQRTTQTTGGIGG